MGITSLIRRVQWYHNKHGWSKLIWLGVAKTWDRVNKKEYINFLDLHSLEVDDTFKQAGVNVGCFSKESDIPDNDIEQLIKHKNKEILSQFLSRFFKRGATLWLAKKDGDIVSLIWSLNGGFSGFYTGIPICPNDTIVFAGETFPEFRGHNYFAMMILLICEQLKLGGMSRVYVAAHINNKESQKAQSKILKRIGAVRYFQLSNYHIAIWDKKSLFHKAFDQDI